MRVPIAVAAVLGLLVPIAAAGQTTPATADFGRLTRTAPTGTVLQLSLADAIARGLQYNLAAILQDEERHAASGARLARAGGWALRGGAAIFSGSLYALALTDVKILGAITPIGGLGLMLGFVLIAVGCLRRT